MFDIGWTEILMIAVMAIVIFPSKDLPRLLRTTGQMIGRLRRMAGEFQSQFNSALREAEREVNLTDTRKQIEDIKSLNPLTDVKKALNPLRSAGEDIRRELTGGGAAAKDANASTRVASQFVPPDTKSPSAKPSAIPAAEPQAPKAAEPAPVPIDVPVAPVEPRRKAAVKAAAGTEPAARPAVRKAPTKSPINAEAPPPSKARTRKKTDEKASEGGSA
jgi:sec-independent protein translocase protein TatB